MQLLFNIGLTFGLSSIWVIFLMVMFFKLDNNIQFKKDHLVKLILPVSFFHAILLNVLPGLIFPFVFFIFLSLILAIASNVKLLKSLKSIGKIFIVTLVFEVLISILLKEVFNLNTTNMQINFANLLYCLPIKIMEIGIVLLWKGRKLKWAFGSF